MKKSLIATLILATATAHGTDLKRAFVAKPSLISSQFSSALNRPSGSEGVGGGDICEERIQNVRNDLRTWIQSGGAKALNLPYGSDLNSYTDLMTKQIDKAAISCVGKGDPGYPVSVSGVPKVCRFDRTENTSQITCDFEKMMAMSESDQYVMTHHEYAGLAGLENPNGATSDYQISNQMTSYLEDRVVKRLVVKEPASKIENPIGLEPVPTPEALKLKKSFFDRVSSLNPSCSLTNGERLDDRGVWNTVFAVLAPHTDYMYKYAQVTRTKDRRYVQFLLLGDPELTYSFEKENLRVFTVRLNAAGTEIVGATIAGYKKGVNNIGTLTKPVFKVAPRASDKFYSGYCNFN